MFFLVLTTEIVQVFVSYVLTCFNDYLLIKSEAKGLTFQDIHTVYDFLYSTAKIKH